MQPNTNLLLHAVPGFILLFITETVLLVKEHNFKLHKKDLPASFWLGIGFLISSFIGKSMIIFFYSLIYNYRIFNFDSIKWYIWVFCFLAEDLTYYWFHRISHTVRFFWASHVVHHSSEVYSYAAAFREGWTGVFTGVFLFWAWMPLAGIEPGIVIFIKSISSIYQFWLHTEKIKKMPRWFEFIFNTPSHHRVHHGSDLVYLDKNYAGILIVWDRIFGTYEKEIFKPHYGLTKKMSSANPVKIAFFEWINLFRDIKKAKGMTDLCSYLFKAPGWSRDGKSKTTRELRGLTSVKAVENEVLICKPE
ncbi:MAG: sterol desaturase family protein [Panacibacter sp.]